MSAAIAGGRPQPGGPSSGAQVPRPANSAPGPEGEGVDWSAMEDDLAEVMPPRFARAGQAPDPVRGDADRTFDVETSPVRLADVGGMDEVKKRLELAFLGPLRNPKLRTLFGKSLRGGLLLYGPPGCGKTFLTRPRSSSTICATDRSPASTLPGWSPPPRTSPVPTSPTCVKPPPSMRCTTRSPPARYG